MEHLLTKDYMFSIKFSQNVFSEKYYFDVQKMFVNTKHKKAVHTLAFWLEKQNKNGEKIINFQFYCVHVFI